MNKYIYLLGIIVLLSACGQTTKSEKTETNSTTIDKEVKEKQYPEALARVFEAHGGIKTWKKQRTLVFDIPKPSGTETHTTDLWSRKDRIDTPKYQMGFDGERPWLLDNEKVYEGNVEFYHNLMFYFYAMPFILSDDGIVYRETEDLVFEGKSYPGIGIGYLDGVGTTPKDEYFIHYNPDTHQMEWLGYTVTYRTGEKSDNVKWIRYDNWAKVDNLLLPKSLSWYEYEGRTIKGFRSKVGFESIAISEEAKPASFYFKPEAAEYYGN